MWELLQNCAYRLVSGSVASSMGSANAKRLPVAGGLNGILSLPNCAIVYKSGRLFREMWNFDLEVLAAKPDCDGVSGIKKVLTSKQYTAGGRINYGEIAVSSSEDMFTIWLSRYGDMFPVMKWHIV